MTDAQPVRRHTNIPLAALEVDDQNVRRNAAAEEAHDEPKDTRLRDVTGCLSCPDCSASLHGLLVPDGLVTCGECGSTFMVRMERRPVAVADLFD